MKPWIKATLTVVIGFLAVLSLATFTLWRSFAPESWGQRKARFEKAGNAGMKIVAAINKYITEHGSPPSSLQALVPKYLMEIPSTGLRDYPAFNYRTFSDPKLSLAWYDLGSRNGKPVAGLWVYVQGNPEHAIMAFTLDQNESVVDARVDRMPTEYEPVEFDRDKWLQREFRIEMARSVSNHVALKGALFADVKQTLGEPDETTVLRDSSWELRIECSWGMVNWDTFFYWPSERYPSNIYGGSTELIGKWAYVHE